ncbi:MAG: helix-turn-helix transcriptional regulator [Lachnospiraceae bacterium]|nr:helix-turn-helix transcriptional regulator [Agathobacter sp.]MBQ3162962.1 helix-turn-helix transcriptional regulator [Lachnospiraceae bacterium]
MNVKHQKTYPLKIPITEYPDFSDRLKVTMKLRGCSVEELAKKTYLSKAAICGYRKGIRTPNLVILKLIATTLDVSSDFLIGLKEYIYI